MESFMTPQIQKQKRDKLLQVPMSEKEIEAVDALAKPMGWSRSAVMRFGISKLTLKKMEKASPPGNRRM